MQRQHGSCVAKKTLSDGGHFFSAGSALHCSIAYTCDVCMHAGRHKTPTYSLASARIEPEPSLVRKPPKRTAIPGFLCA
eukprot:4785630-Pleurochrysis_carterae.AAC.1